MSAAEVVLSLPRRAREPGSGEFGQPVTRRRLPGRTGKIGEDRGFALSATHH
jgi:hypothetical protein